MVHPSFSSSLLPPLSLYRRRRRLLPLAARRGGLRLLLSSSYFLLFLLLAPLLLHHALPANAVTAVETAGEQCLSITMSTPGDCVDTSDYLDAQGYDCSENEGVDCWVDIFPYGYSILEVLDILVNCPASCSLCSGTETMAVELYDYSTGAAPVYSHGTSFTGIGPTFGAPSDALVTETVCVATPSCYEISLITPSSVALTTRTRFEVATLPDGVVIASGRGYSSTADDGISFCLARCPEANTAFDVLSRTCRGCDKGMINEGGYCVHCKAGAYLQKGGDDSGSSPAAHCEQCPDPNIWSLDGAKSVSECFPIDLNLYMVNKNQRIVGFSHDSDSYSIVAADDGNLVTPWDIVFLTSTSFVVIDQNKFLVYDVDGTLLCKFQLPGAMNLSGGYKLPSSSGIILAATEYSSNKVHVISLDGLFNEEGRCVGDGDDGESGEIIPIFSSPDDFQVKNPLYVALGEFDDEILVSSQGLEVFRVCTSLSCNSSRNSRILTANIPYDPAMFNMGYYGIATIRSENVYLISQPSESKIFRCDLAPDDPDNAQTATSCTTFATSGLLEPRGIYVDSVRELVYIADFQLDVVRVFSYQGGDPVSQLGAKSGGLKAPRGMAVRPGFYAPFSTVAIPTDKKIAGAEIRIRVELRDVYGQDAAATEASRFSIFATGETFFAGGSSAMVTWKGSVELGDGSDVISGGSSSALSTDIVLRTAGNWTISIVESGAAVSSHLGDSSPFTIQIFPAATAADFCKARHNSTVISGDTWKITVEPFDEFANPTTDETDIFEGWFQGRESDVFSLGRRLERNQSKREGPLTFFYSRVTRSIGTNIVHIKHTNSGKEITGSPFTFQVLPPPSSNTVSKSSWYGIFGAGGAALFFGAYVASKVRRYMKKSFVPVSTVNIRKLVAKVTIGAVDFAIDVVQFRNNLSACSRQKVVVSLAFGAGTIASFVDLALVLFYLSKHLMVGQVHMKDEMSDTYEALLNASEKARSQIAQESNVLLRMKMAAKNQLKAVKVVPSAVSSNLRKMILGGVKAEDTRFRSGSDEEFLRFMGERRNLEQDLELVNQTVVLALGVFLVACFEDAPQLAVNSFRVITGCNTDGLDMTTCGAKDDEYLWTSSNTAMYFYSLKSAGGFCLKCLEFSRLPERRRRILELKEMIDKKTEECKDNRAMNAAEKSIS